MGPLRGVRDWFYDRLGLERVLDVLLRHPVPRAATRGRAGWMYVLGFATLIAFALQIVTGIGLATVYVPAADRAHETLRFITDELWLGGFLRGMHYFGASAMVVLIVLHALRVFLAGSYKFPRELNWITGVILLVLTLAMTFTGQLLRWDANGVWGVFVASHYAARVPLIGDLLKEFILAGETVGGVTLSRFYVFHVILMPLLILAVFGVHFYLVLRHGISEPPEPGRPVEPATYRQWYRSLLERDGVPYFPNAAWREVVAGVVVVTVVIILALTIGARGPGEPPDPTLIPREPKPDWFLLWYYGLLSIKPPRIETFMMVYMPLLALGGLILLPLLFNRGERSLRRRPWAVVAVVVFATGFGILTELGARAPWVMDFEAAMPAPSLAGLSQEERLIVSEGARVYEDRGCLYCHAMEGVGGEYGPSLAGVTHRLPVEVVTARILQGVGNMPGYRGILPRDELAALMTYLATVEPD